VIPVSCRLAVNEILLRGQVARAQREIESSSSSFSHPTPNETQDFYSISFIETSLIEVFAVKNFQVQLHGNPLRLDVEFP
jgi:hypothetical protein